MFEFEHFSHVKRPDECSTSGHRPLLSYGRYTGERWVIEVKYGLLMPRTDREWEDWQWISVLNLATESRTPLAGFPYGAIMYHWDWGEGHDDVETPFQMVRSRSGVDRLAQWIIQKAPSVGYEEVGCALYGSHFNDPDF